jgi:hypothetical protein
MKEAIISVDINGTTKLWNRTEYVQSRWFVDSTTGLHDIKLYI